MATEPSLPPDAGRTVARLARVVEQALAELDLSPSQFRALAFLSEDGAAAAATALAGRMAVSKPSITALVDGLVHRGLVERHPSELDRRRVEHVLTPAGSQVLAQADKAVHARLRGLLEHLDEDDATAAGRGLARWSTALTRARSALMAGR